MTLTEDIKNHIKVGRKAKPVVIEIIDNGEVSKTKFNSVTELHKETGLAFGTIYNIIRNPNKYDTISIYYA